MTIATVIDAFQTVNATVTGGGYTVTAPGLANYPDSIEHYDRPLALTFCGPGSPYMTAGSSIYHIRDYIVSVFINSTAQGIGWENYEAAVALLQAFIEKYMDDITLGSGVRHINMPIEDTGILDNVGESGYMGFQFTLEVKEFIT